MQTTEDVFVIPTSFAQQRLWVLDRLEPGTSAFNMSAAVRLTGALDVEALQRSLNEVVRRHESLRTTFADADGEPVQVIAPHLLLALPVTDFAGVAEEEREALVLRRAAEDARRPLDLSKGPLVRTQLLRLSAEEHVLLLTMHHIISDGWSVGVFVKEMSALYGAYSSGRPSPLEEPPIQYADYALWQRERLHGEAPHETVAYWKERLGGELPVLQMPLDYARPVMQTYRGGRERLVLPAEVGRALKRLGLESGATLFMTLLAGFKALLQRYTNQDDILVGTPVAGRDRAETADLIGCFLNTLVLRTDLAGDPTFRELLGRVRALTLEAYAHQELPFEKLLEELQPERALSHTPVFQVFFNMLNLPGGRVELPGLTVELLSPPEVESKFDLTVYVEEVGPEIQFDLVYNADLFAPERMAEMLRQFGHLLTQVAAEPDKRLAEYSLVTPAAERLLPHPAEALGDGWFGAVHDLFAAQARRLQHKTAVEDKRESWTYEELDGVSDRLATLLRESGVGRGDVVAIYGHRSCPIVWALLGVMKAGAAFTILDPAYPAARHTACLSLIGPRALLQVEAAGELPQALEDYVSEANMHCRVVLRARDGRDASELLSGFGADGRHANVGPDDTAYIAFTSGSTGTPKGTVGRHGPLTHFLPWLAERFGLGESDRFTMLSGISHDPLHRDIFTPLGLGATVCIPDPDTLASPGAVAEWLEREAITVTHLTPAMGQLITEVGAAGRRPRAESLRLAFFVGDVLTKNDVARLCELAPSVTVVNYYGSTETQRAVGYFVVPGGDGYAREVLPLGRGIKDVQLLVLNASGRLAGVGEAGEIFLRSPHLARGYFGDDALTAERFLTNPFTGTTGDRVYRTGDLGRYLPDGNVEPLGRADSQVKIRGFRVELGEIEATLGKHASVCEAVVIAREDAPGRKRLVAYVVAQHGQRAESGALRGYLKEKLPEYMVPSAFVVLDSLPVTPNGKVNRRALPAPDDATSASAPTFIAPRTAVEELIASIWSQVLGLESVGVEDDFFELGGHSLLATQVISRVRDAFGVEVALRRLFVEPTVAGLARLVEAATRAGEVGEEIPLVRRERAGGAWPPLSFAQQRMWFLDQLEEGNPFYNIFAAVRLDGRLDRAVLERSVNEIVLRHESLRTTFVNAGGQSAQVIAPAMSVPLALEDLSGLSEVEQEREVLRRAEEEARRGFDLSAGPLLRLRLLRLGEAEHVVLLTMHHIISDGWSSELLVREVATLYEAFSKGEASPLAALPVQYADFAEWQREWLRGPRLEAQLSYWTRQLEGAPALLELPTDRPRPAVQSFRGASRQLNLDADLTRSLKRLSRGEGVTLFMTLAAGFNALLHRHTGAADISVGTPVAGRNRVETEHLIGFFSNTLVLRTDLSGDPTFRELLGRMREVALGAYAHQDVPFEMLVEKLQPARSLSHTPLFQAALALQNVPAPALEVPGLRVTPLDVEGGTAKFDLLLTVHDTEEGLKCRLQYNTDLFDDSTVERMGGHLRNLLVGAVAEPGRRLSELPLLSEEERTQLLRGWNDTSTRFPRDSRIEQLFERQAALRPDAIALTFEGGQMTYGELDVRAAALAHRLRAEGVTRETLVGVFLERSPEMVVAFLATLKAGGAYVPFDPSQPAERLSLMLEDSRVPVLLTTSDLLARLPRHEARVVCLDEADGVTWVEAGAVEIETSAGDLAYVIYTSGSTGRPKGVQITHANVARLFSAADRWFGFGDSDVWTLFHSYAFDFSVWEMWGALCYGGRLVVVPYWVSRSPEEFAALVARERVTVLNQTPSAFRQFIRAEQGLAPDRVGALRVVIFGGEALELQSLKPWVERHGDEHPRLVNMYGITETTVHVTYQPLTLAEIEGAAGSLIGRPIPDLQVYVLDGRMQPAPVGVRGEMYVGGDGLARGYLNAPELSAQRFVASPFDEGGARLYKTGDLARFLADGRLEYLGRLDQQVKVRGFRIELGEIESALAAHPSVRESLVIAEEGGAGEKHLVAYLAVGADAPAVGELRDFLGRKLPEYMVPHAFVMLDAFPLTPNGKLDRKALALAGRAQTEVTGGAGFVAANNAVEQVLAEIWSQVLGVERVSVHDNFFELGGDSILCIQVTTKANQAGIRVTPKQLFQHQTVAGLAAVATVAGPEPSVEQSPVNGSVPLTPIQRQFFEQNRPEPHHYNQAVLLEVEPTLDAALLESAFRILVGHHDALRMRYTSGEGGWLQTIEAEVETPRVARVDLAGVPEPELASAIESTAAEAQASLHLSEGPLVRVVLFDLGGGRTGRLLIVIHHLVVDGVSWRILLEDLQTCYAQLGRGESPALPARTTSFKHWAERLGEYARSGRLAEEAGYWLDASRAGADTLPAGEKGAAVSTRAVTLWLTAEETRALLQDMPSLHRAQMNDVLLTALALAFKEQTGAGSLLVELEGHGREDVVEGVDLSRTVGWFTTLFPVSLDVNETDGPASALKAVKEQLRAVPNKGIGYGLLRYMCDKSLAASLSRRPQPRVRFNYLGQFDRISGDAARFRAARESSGPAMSPKASPERALEINSRVHEGRLEVSWKYGEDLSADAVGKLADAYAAELRKLLRLCHPEAAGLYTPSDFPLANVNQTTLDRLCKNERSVEDIYPLSALQHGLLFHTLQDMQEGRPDVGFLYLTCDLRGALDTDAFRRAWDAVLRRHTILRTSFAWEGLDEPLQVVHGEVELPFEQEDWRGVSAERQRERFESYLQANRLRGFEPSEAPLVRLALFRTSDDSHQLVWSYHHLIMDGWSVPVLIREVLSFYEALTGGRELGHGPARPFGDYIGWLRRQDMGAAEGFWRASLKGLSAPTPLERIGPPASFNVGEEHYGEQSVVLAEDEASRLRAFARANRLTLNTLALGAWALLLNHYSGDEEVLFGVVVSGRPAELVGAETMVGMLINTLAFRARVASSEELAGWLSNLQERQAEQRQYEFSPLVEVQRWSEVRGGRPLFESLLNFMNYPVDEAVREWGGPVSVEDLRYVERVSYPLNLVVSERGRLELKIKFDRRRFAPASITRLLALLRSLLSEFAARPTARLGEFREFLDGADREQHSAQQKDFKEARRRMLHSAKLKGQRGNN